MLRSISTRWSIKWQTTGLSTGLSFAWRNSCKNDTVPIISLQFSVCCLPVSMLFMALGLGIWGHFGVFLCFCWWWTECCSSLMDVAWLTVGRRKWWWAYARKLGRHTRDHWGRLQESPQIPWGCWAVTTAKINAEGCSIHPCGKLFSACCPQDAVHKIERGPLSVPLRSPISISVLCWPSSRIGYSRLARLVFLVGCSWESGHQTGGQEHEREWVQGSHSGTPVHVQSLNAREWVKSSWCFSEAGYAHVQSQDCFCDTALSCKLSLQILHNRDMSLMLFHSGFLFTDFLSAACFCGCENRESAGANGFCKACKKHRMYIFARRGLTTCWPRGHVQGCPGTSTAPRWSVHSTGYAAHPWCPSGRAWLFTTPHWNTSDSRDFQGANLHQTSKRCIFASCAWCDQSLWSALPSLRGFGHWQVKEKLEEMAMKMRFVAECHTRIILQSSGTDVTGSSVGVYEFMCSKTNALYIAAPPGTMPLAGVLSQAISRALQLPVRLHWTCYSLVP